MTSRAAEPTAHATRPPGFRGAGVIGYEPEPSEDFGLPDLDTIADELYEARESAIEAREPFTFRDEADQTARAAVYGDMDDLSWFRRKQERREQQDRDFWENTAPTAPLASADLAALFDYDADFDCDEDDLDDDSPVDPALEAIGRALYEKNPDFWRRLRRFGRRGIPTSLVAEANDLLFPSGWDRPRDEKGLASVPASRRRLPCQALMGRRRESSTSPRRAAKRGASRAGPDDDGESEPAGASPGARRRTHTTGAAARRIAGRTEANRADGAGARP